MRGGGRYRHPWWIKLAEEDTLRNKLEEASWRGRQVNQDGGGGKHTERRAGGGCIA